MSEVLMPQMGESIVEGTVTKWLKQVGDKVERDEPLFEITTDKVDSEVPSPEAGVLEEILVQEGETVEINTVVAKIGSGDGAAAKNGSKAEKPEAKVEAKAEKKAEAKAAPEEPEAKEETPTAPAAAAADVASGERIRSSPLVKRLAREHGIDLSQVKGTGQGGRISKKDIEAHIEAAKATPSGAAPAAALDMVPISALPPAPAARFGNFTTEPISQMRRRIAEHMVMSKRVSPHVSTLHQVDCTAIARLRAKYKDQFLEHNGVKLTFMPFFLRAAAAALKEYPLVNASLDGDTVVYHKDVNIGMAVALDWGLIVPVIKNVDEKSVLGLQRAVNDLAERARHKQLKPEEIQQSTFSISNYGSYGSLLATPAINQPNVAIMGLGAIQKAPVVIDDAIAIRSISYVTLTFDHRLIDGAVADLFLSHVRRVIEGWSEPIL